MSEGRGIVHGIMKGLREDAFLIHRLMRLRAHDDDTMARCLDVSVIVAQASALGLPESRLQEIGLAAQFHDIGKEMVPSEVLPKPGKIDAQEFARMSEHPSLGANILRKIDCGSNLPPIVCFEHRIKYDRSGYPRTAYGGPLHPVSYLTQITDVYDALRT